MNGYGDSNNVNAANGVGFSGNRRRVTQENLTYVTNIRYDSEWNENLNENLNFNSNRGRSTNRDSFYWHRGVGKMNDGKDVQVREKLQGNSVNLVDKNAKMEVSTSKSDYKPPIIGKDIYDSNNEPKRLREIMQKSHVPLENPAAMPVANNSKYKSLSTLANEDVDEARGKIQMALPTMTSSTATIQLGDANEKLSYELTSQSDFRNAINDNANGDYNSSRNQKMMMLLTSRGSSMTMPMINKLNSSSNVNSSRSGMINNSIDSVKKAMRINTKDDQTDTESNSIGESVAQDSYRNISPDYWKSFDRKPLGHKSLEKMFTDINFPRHSENTNNEFDEDVEEIEDDLTEIKPISNNSSNNVSNEICIPKLKLATMIEDRENLTNKQSVLSSHRNDRIQMQYDNLKKSNIVFRSEDDGSVMINNSTSRATYTFPEKEIYASKNKTKIKRPEEYFLYGDENSSSKAGDISSNRNNFKIPPSCYYREERLATQKGFQSNLNKNRHSAIFDEESKQKMEVETTSNAMMEGIALYGIQAYLDSTTLGHEISKDRQKPSFRFNYEDDRKNSDKNTEMNINNIGLDPMFKQQRKKAIGIRATYQKSNIFDTSNIYGRQLSNDKDEDVMMKRSVNYSQYGGDIKNVEIVLATVKANIEEGRAIANKMNHSHFQDGLQ